MKVPENHLAWVHTEKWSGVTDQRKVSVIAMVIAV